MHLTLFIDSEATSQARGLFITNRIDRKSILKRTLSQTFLLPSLVIIMTGSKVEGKEKEQGK